MMTKKDLEIEVESLGKELDLAIDIIRSPRRLNFGWDGHGYSYFIDGKPIGDSIEQAIRRKARNLH